MKLYLIRHTAVDVAQGTCYGHTDVGLKESFTQEASVVAQKLSDKVFDAVYCSPLSRCRRLCHYCGYNHAVLDDRLKELYFGDWEYRPWDALDMSVWQTDWVNTAPPNGESFAQMYERVTSFFEQLRTEPFESVAIFTHGGVISCARVYFEQADIYKTFELMPAYGQIVSFEG